jgi:hypothetical protein
MVWRHFLRTAVILCIGWTFGGCANNSQTASSTNTGSSARTYTSDDLQRTGKRESGEALKSADSAVTTTTGGR